MIKIDEVKRYLNIKGDDGVDENLIMYIANEIELNITPRLISGDFNIKKIDDEYLIEGTNVVLKGNLISKTLQKCDSIVMFVATLTAVADNMIREYSAKDMAKAVILNACLSVYLEDFADDYQAQLKDGLQKDKKGITRRISCGYGDFNMSYQPAIIELLRADKYLGVHCSESNMMTPIKTITALIGVGKNLYKSSESDCKGCGGCGANCDYRKEEK